MIPKNLNYRKLAWSIVIILFSFSLVLSVFTAHNYTEIAKARILADVSTMTDQSLTFDGSGTLESINLTIDFTVNNPSGKELRIWILSYKGWIRDYAMEDGTDTSRWMVDGNLPVNDTEQRYYPVFSASFSFDSPVILLEPKSNVTITRYLELNREIDPTIMSNVLGIYNYSVSGGLEVQWYDYTSAIIFIQDIPPYSGPEKDANVIRRYEGFDLTPGVGGVGQ